MLGLPTEELNLEESVKNLLLVGDIASIPQFCCSMMLLARRAGVGDALVGRTYYLNMYAKTKVIIDPRSADAVFALDLNPSSNSYKC